MCMKQNPQFIILIDFNKIVFFIKFYKYIHRENDRAGHDKRPLCKQEKGPREPHR